MNQKYKDLKGIYTKYTQDVFTLRPTPDIKDVSVMTQLLNENEKH